MGLKKRLKGSRVYFDTNIFIYMLEGSKELSKPIDILQQGIQSQEFSVYSSELVFTEILPPLVRDDKTNIIKLTVSFLSQGSVFNLAPIDRDVSIQAGYLRGQSKMKSPDALHVATALFQKCDIFLTNDKGIKTPTGLERIILSDFK